MPEANSAPFLSNSISRYPRIAFEPAQQKPKLPDRLRDALRSRHSFTTHLLKGGYDYGKPKTFPTAQVKKREKRSISKEHKYRIFHDSRTSVGSISFFWSPIKGFWLRWPK